MIYIFGDSFAEPFPEIEWTWVNQVSSMLGHKQKNLGFGGSGLEYTFEQFEQYHDYITKDDLVIICLTNEDRGYWFKQYPSVNTAEAVQYILHKHTISKEELVAIKYYQTYFLDIHKSKMIVNLKNFLNTINNLAEKLQIKILVINAVLEYKIDFTRYKNLLVSKGRLLEISNKEIKNFKLVEELNKHWDKRPNHLCRSNHIVLANKVVDSIINNVVLDLTTEFHQNIIKELTFSIEI